MKKPVVKILFTFLSAFFFFNLVPLAAAGNEEEGVTLEPIRIDDPTELVNADFA